MKLFASAAPQNCPYPVRNIGFGVFGQSNELGEGKTLTSGDPTVPANYAYANNTSGSNSSISDPIAPGTTGAGSMWPVLTDLMWGRGIRPKWVNAAIGSLGFVTYVSNFCNVWSANATYFCSTRSSQGTGDGGDKGTIISTGTGPYQVWQCVGGSSAVYASLDGASPAVNIGGTNYNNLSYLIGVNVSSTGSTAPNWTSVTTVGNTMTDNQVTWKLVENASAKAPGYVFDQTSPYFDRLGLLARCKSHMDAMSGVSRKIIILQNGQGDAGSAASWYQTALINITNYFLAQGYEVAIGFTVYDAEDGTTVYNNLSSAVTNAIANFAENSSVHTGANLYTSMGLLNTPPNLYPEVSTYNTFTGSITGTALSVSSGTSPAVGQTISGTGVTSGTIVVSGSGASFVVSPSQTVSSGTSMSGANYVHMTSNYGLPLAAGYWNSALLAAGI